MRFFVAQDDSCHWYLIPNEYREDWEEWSNLPYSEDDSRTWEAPKYARSIDSPSNLSFIDPKDERNF